MSSYIGLFLRKRQSAPAHIRSIPPSVTVPVFRRAASCVAALSLALTAPLATAEDSRPFGVTPEVSVRLGDCPVAALRRAWDGLDTLEALAVEEEVLRLCTDRAERIAAFLEAQGAIDTAMTGLLPPPPDGGPGPDMSFDAEPVDPVLRPAPDSDPAAPTDIRTDREPGAPDRETIDSPTPTQTVWQVLYTVRAGEGAWTASITGTREVPVPLFPTAPPDGALDTASGMPAPVFDWITKTDGPLLRKAGDTLPDGRRIARIDAAGVAVGDPGPLETLPWVGNTADSNRPGAAHWVVSPVGEDD